MATPDPSGCRHCGIGQREHMQRWKPPVGWHAWTEPTWAQRRERILARHAADTAAALDRAHNRGERRDE